MLLNNDIPKKIGQMILHFKRKKCNFVHYWKIFKNKLQLFHLNKMSTKYEI
jgi:hypothetical protein